MYWFKCCCYTASSIFLIESNNTKQYIIAFARNAHNALHLCVFFFSFFLFFCQPYPKYQPIWSKKIFYRLSNS